MFGLNLATDICKITIIPMPYDVIIVLAGGITDDGQLPLSVKNRIHLAKELFSQHLASDIIMAGKWSKYREKHQPPRTEATAMVEYAQSIGLSPEVLHKEEQSHNTASNIKSVRTLFLEPYNWKRVIIVTSDFHLPRVRKIVDTQLSASFTVRYETAPASSNAFKRLKWHVSEKAALAANWFLEHVGEHA